MIIKRYAFKEIADHLLAREITILIGPRQVGKTTIMEALREQVEKMAMPYIWFNLDVESDAGWFASQETLRSKVGLEFNKKPGVVFIDEIQRKADAGRFLKGLYDTLPDVKFVVSGSGSLELKEHIVESLAGRKRMFEILPISFYELVDFKTAYRYSDRLLNFLDLHSDERLSFLSEHLSFGGYPKVVLAETANEKQRILLEIMSSYLNRDISAITAIAKKADYNQLLRLLAVQVGSVISYSQLSQSVTITSQTVKDYLWYMVHTFMIRLSLPFFRNATKEITKAPVGYFVDLGMSNQLSMQGQLIQDVSQHGLLFQNWVFNELFFLFRNDFVELKHWRTTDKAEVDIMLEWGSIAFPVEVKTSANYHSQISRSFRSFLQKYKPPQAFVVSRTPAWQLKVEDTQVYGIPFYQLPRIRNVILEK